MKFAYVVILGLIFIAIGCNKKKEEESPINRQTLSKKRAESTLPKNQQSILSIEEKHFQNSDFLSFLEIQYNEIAKTDRTMSRLFDSFVDHKIILYSAQMKDIKVTQDDIKTYLSSIKTDETSTDIESLMDVIKVEKYLNKEIYSKIDISEAELHEYYDSHPEEFKSKTEVELHQIMVDNREKAIKIRGLLKSNPEKFAEIAEAESIAPEKKMNGFMGYFEKGMLPEEMESTVFSLDVNEISEVAETAYGFHIFKVSKKQQKERKVFDNVKDQIKTNLLSGKLDLAYRNLLQQLKKQLNIAVFYENLQFSYIKANGDAS